MATVNSSLAFWHPSGPENWTWTKDVPVKGGLYWHSNGDPDCAPVPLNISSAYQGRPSFVMCGQYGYREAIDCIELGGWWMPVIEPHTLDETKLEG